jgi:hypothetical protein
MSAIGGTAAHAGTTPEWPSLDPKRTTPLKRKRVGANNDGQRITSQRLRGEHIDLTKYKFGQFS